MKPLKIFLIILLIIFGCKSENVPKVATLYIGSITQTSATCLGNIISMGECDMIYKGFYYGAFYDLSLMDSIRVKGSSIGNYACNLTSLNPGSNYFIRAFATNCYGTGYGDTISFTTEPPTVPEAITYSQIIVTQSTATFYGVVISTGASKIIDRGFCWSISENPTLSDNCISGDQNSALIFAAISGLEPNTKYYVRAYATNQSVGTGYGNTETFTTCSEVNNTSLIGSWQNVTDPGCGYDQSYTFGTKLEITSDSVFTQYFRGEIDFSSKFKIKSGSEGYDTIFFHDPPHRYLLIQLICCNNLQLVDPHVLDIAGHCEFYTRIK